MGRALVERLGLVFVTLVSRFVFRSERLYDLDSVNFALALTDFDPSLHQPHPPGYYLYVLAGRLMQLALPDANDALVALSVIAGVITVAALYELAQAMYGGRAGLYAGAAFVLSPLCWFHGTVALTYSVELAGAAVVGWLCWRATKGDGRAAVWSGVALAALVGFRQSAILFLGPLWAYSISRRRPREFAASAAAFGLCCLIWFVPMILDAGGPGRYFSALENLWLAVPAKQTVAAQGFVAGAGLAAARVATIAFILELSLGAFAVVGLLRLRKPDPEAGRRAFVLFWVAPGLTFFAAIYLIFVNSGYLLVITPPLFAWLGGVLDRYVRDSPPSQTRPCLTACAAVNVFVFLWAPLYCSHDRVQSFERDLDRTIRHIRTNFSPDTTMIVAFDAHFFGFRHAGYYLPEFVTIAYPAANFPDGPPIFSVKGRRTARLPIPPPGFENLVFFPLPSGRRYEEHFRRNVTQRIGESRIETLFADEIRIRFTDASALEELYLNLAGTPETEYRSTLRVNCCIHGLR